MLYLGMPCLISLSAKGRVELSGLIKTVLGPIFVVSFQEPAPLPKQKYICLYITGTAWLTIFKQGPTAEQSNQKPETQPWPNPLSQALSSMFEVRGQADQPALQCALRSTPSVNLLFDLHHMFEKIFIHPSCMHACIGAARLILKHQMMPQMQLRPAAIQVFAGRNGPSCQCHIKLHKNISHRFLVLMLLRCKKPASTRNHRQDTVRCPQAGTQQHMPSQIASFQLKNKPTQNYIAIESFAANLRIFLRPKCQVCFCEAPEGHGMPMITSKILQPR